MANPARQEDPQMHLLEATNSAVLHLPPSVCGVASAERYHGDARTDLKPQNSIATTTAADMCTIAAVSPVALELATATL